MSRHPSIAVLAALVVAALAPAQRGVRAVTTSAESHQDAKISPDGSTIAFRGPNKLAVVPYVGGAELVLATSSTLGEFLWTPTGGGLYFIDAGTVKYVTRTGGSVITVRAIPGQQQHIHCVTKDDKSIYGSRYDPTSTRFTIFTLATNGQSAPSDIVQSVLTLDAVALDPSGAKMVYREYYGGTPFANREYWLALSSGVGAVSLTNGPISGQLDQAEFVDNGNTVAFTSIATTIPTFQIGTLANGNSTIRYLTDSPGLARRSSVFPDRKWIACESSFPPASGARIAIIPADGGGKILLDPNKPLTLYGNPTADAGGTKIAFCAIEQGVTTIPQVYAIELDRELRIRPRLETGKIAFFELPVGLNDLGGFFLAGGLASTPLTIGGLQYSYDLDLATSVPIYNGTSGSGVLQLVIGVPNDPALVGQVLYWQGLRVSLISVTGDFTRWVSTRIF